VFFHKMRDIDDGKSKMLESSAMTVRNALICVNRSPAAQNLCYAGSNRAK